MSATELRVVLIAIEIVAFLFAISVHESAHALVAYWNGDPTARQLGRVSLNPIRHIDLFGTIIFPLIGLFSGVGLFGWAKPTPVLARNFRNYRLGDILTTLAGPASNFVIAGVCTFLLAAIAQSSPAGRAMVATVLDGGIRFTSSWLMPVCLLLWFSVTLNFVLGVFNLIPVPPLDGSHVIRHILPLPLLRLYDQIGPFGLVLLFVMGGRYLGYAVAPFIHWSESLLARIVY
jgi:Zn-dependent protease